MNRYQMAKTIEILGITKCSIDQVFGDGYSIKNPKLVGDIALIVDKTFNEDVFNDMLSNKKLDIETHLES